MRNWKVAGLFEKMNFLLTKDTRIKIGRNPEPTAAIVDSQSIKTTEKGALKVTTELRKSKVVKGIL
jgi:putative transposase